MKVLSSLLKKSLIASTLCLPSLVMAGVPDSVYVRPIPSSRGDGLFVEWSSDGSLWNPTTSGRILGSDYGTWGREKKMYNPSLANGADGLVVLVFQVNNRVNQFGVATTKDFIHWRPQDYPYMKGVGQCLDPQVSYDGLWYYVFFHNAENKYYRTTSTDLVYFTDPVLVDVDAMKPARNYARVAYHTVENMVSNQVAFGVRESRYNELAKDDATRFADLKDVKAEVTINATHPKAISDKLIGIFFEDINYAADGGLNAQLVQNGDFEYTPHDRGNDTNWNTFHSWSVVDARGRDAVLSQAEGVSAMNRHAARITISDANVGAGLSNGGFDGIPLKAGAKYDFTMRLKGEKGSRLQIILLDENGEQLGVGEVKAKGDEWTSVKTVIKANGDCKNASLVIRPSMAGQYIVDMVSLIPQDTYKKHGLRRDLAELLADIHPRFMRFPGGCVAHGDGLSNIYHWKETIGPLEDRKPLRNLWGYHQSRQIGYYEFFQMCEDMGMEPLPVVAAGVPCQNSSDGGDGQMGGLPFKKDLAYGDTLTYTMEQYGQDLLDLIEWANGDASTTWGRKRAEAGHKKPFNLHYLGIGNEDLISPTFEERYLYLCRLVHEKYPDIQICGTVGPFYYGSDYDEGWRIANSNKDIIAMVDEHYYVSPGWYIYNQDFYDRYDRNAPKVYLGEYASHGPGRKSTIETALTEAMHICGLERNGDIVHMSSYAPLLAREGHTQWSPDMIYFNNTEVKPTVGYYAQMMCGQSQGDQYLPSTIQPTVTRTGVAERLAVSTVCDSKTGAIYMKLVNLLPIDIETHLNVHGIEPSKLSAPLSATTLTGPYDSTTACPQPSTIRLGLDNTITLPAYSFTVIKM